MAAGAVLVILYLALTVGLENFGPSSVLDFSRQQPIIFGLAVSATSVIVAAVAFVGRLKTWN
jgi:hypothetical protein